MLRYSFSLFLLLSTIVFGAPGYYINNYDLDIKINEKNIYSIEEKIDVNFTEPRRGIIRSIPAYFDDRKIKISDLRVNKPFSTEGQGSYLNVRIGDPNRYLKGLVNYNIQYNYDLGWDGLNNQDEVYFNLIGNQWDTYIRRVNFTITLPKDFDAKKINFTTGSYGSTDNTAVKWRVSGRTITGYTTKVLGPYEGLTIALPLPEGYFDTETQKNLYRFSTIGIYALMAFFVLLTLGLWYRYGREDKAVETVEFYPPDEMTPTEVGYFIDGYLDVKDITSLIYYWADKGYLEIEETVSGRGIFSQASYKLIKLRDMKKKADAEYEKYLFDSLFSYSPDGKNLNLSYLKERFYSNIQHAKEIFLIDMIYQKKELYSSKSMSIARTARIFPLFIIGGIVARIYFLGFFGIYEAIPAGIISIILILLISRFIKKRTKYSTDILGRLRGFRRFLETAEKNKLEMLIDENPNYFYDILPYAIVLGVTDKWANKFNDLVTEPPQWYHSNAGNAFMLGAFMGSFNRSVSSLGNTMSSVPASTSRGGSSMGGGSSGGGAGGGGGSSW